MKSIRIVKENFNIDDKKKTEQKRRKINIIKETQ